MRMTDPPVRADGRCACGCGRVRQLTKQARRYAGDQIEFDLFARTECCRKFHGIVWSKDEDDATTEKRSAAGRKGNEIRKSLAGLA